jgi:heat shock protein HslJ
MMGNLNLASCAPAVTLNNTLNHTSWILVKVNDLAVIPDSFISLDFENDTVTGTDGCNRYHASYTLNADKLTVNKNIANTLMACPNPITQQASAYLSALTAATGYKMDDQQLLLINAENKILASFIKQSMELSGTSWLVTSSNNGKQAVVSSIIDSKLTIDFSKDGKMTGSAGCNNYTASYKVSGKTIIIASIGTTRKICAKPEGVMEQEGQFLKVLTTVASYRFDGNRLELRTVDNALAVMSVLAHH